MKVNPTKTNTEVRDNGNTEFVFVLGEDNSVSEIIPSIVASVSGTEVMELQPLYETISPDALDALFSYDDGTPRDGEGSVVFSYESYQVKVQGNSRIRLSRQE